MLSGRPDYDPIAQFYRRHWCSHYHDGLVGMIERFLLSQLEPRSHILDVCCGSGVIAHELSKRGFTVTGIDGSEAMVRFASERAPGGQFVIGDARAFQFPAVFHGAVCTFDSLSYMLDQEDLIRVFRCVWNALRPEGRFVFDLSLEETYKTEWNQSCTIVEEDEACFLRGCYDERARIGRTFITVFSKNGGWSRKDVEFVTRCWSADEVLAGLADAGFGGQFCHPSNSDDALRSGLGPGRACFVATK